MEWAVTEFLSSRRAGVGFRRVCPVGSSALFIRLAKARGMEIPERKSYIILTLHQDAGN